MATIDLPAGPTRGSAEVPSADADEIAAYQRLSAASPASLGALFLERVAASASHEAFLSPDGSGGWTSWTWARCAEHVAELAAGLLALGIAPQDRVAIAASSRIEWVLADLAVMCAGGATTTVYPSTTPDDVGFILSDSGSRVVFAEDAAQLEKVRDHWSDLPDLLAVVVIDADVIGPGSQHAADRCVLSLDALRQKGRALLADQPDVVTRATAAVHPDQLATLMYTSGTTGRPKGVRLAHAAWVYEGATSSASGVLSEDDVQYLWLPLSHCFGKVLLTTQLQVGFCSAVCGDLDRLVENLAAVRPTFMAGAPRTFETVHARVRTQLEAGSPAKARIAAWAFDVGRRVSTIQQAGGRPSGALAFQHRLATRLVLAKIQDRFGGRVRYFVSGSAALSKDVAEWFHAAGIVVLEGYGLTETAAATFVNRPGRFRFGTVGQPFAGTSVRLAPDGEILLKGPGVMLGYHNLPAETAEVLSDDGWLSTGDIGEFVDGCLRITDRKKDLIKTSGGKYVAPQGIESRFKAICPYAGQVVVHGDGRSFITALITLDTDTVLTWAEANGMAGRRYEEVVTSPQAREMVQSYVDRLNERLGRWETVKRFEILPRELTVEDGDLTPSLKLKRRAVERRYAQTLDGLYRD